MKDLESKFLKNVKENYPNDADKIISAYEFAKKAHEGLKRHSGEPYIVHPICVAQILIDNDMDSATIIAGLLHDVVEDTKVTLKEIKETYGEDVAKLVDGVTKITSLEKEKSEVEADSLKKLIISMGSDIRVIFIKLADRLHNMRTIEFLKPEKQVRFANETKDLFIPLADKIGIRSIRSELENLVFKCLHPDEYNEVKTEFDKRYAKDAENVKKVTKKLSDILSKNGIDGKVVCWPEHYYSLYKKSKAQGMAKVYGLMLYKIIVPTEVDCYKTLCYVHKEFIPLPEQIKDFIASPKSNGYQSLQTVIVSEETGIALKVMIRTPEMDKICEYGVSASWQSDTKIKFDETFEKFNTLKDIVDGENFELGSSKSFIGAVKNELSVSSTWVFTPKFKPICLNSERPTAIDFAYALHTDIGNNAISAVVNGKKVSIGAPLATGDVVEIVLSSTPKAPSRNWLSVATTSTARKKIKEYIIKNTTKENIKAGKSVLAKELESQNLTLGDMLKVFESIKKEFDFINVNDMYASIGYKSITVQQVINYVKGKAVSASALKESPVIIEGSEGFANISFPKCCHAIPGDEIVGVLSKDNVAIHNRNCINLPKMAGAQLVDAKWKDNINQLFDASLKIVAKDAVGLAGKLMGLIGENGYNITKIEAKKLNDKDCELILSVTVSAKTEIDGLISMLKTLDGVRDVIRFFD